MYNDYKKTHGSKSLTPEGAESDGNHVLVMDSIYDALGIVKYNQLGEVVESQKADARTKYEGTDQWMKAPNGKTTNLTEDQWLAVRTPAFKLNDPPFLEGRISLVFCLFFLELQCCYLNFLVAVDSSQVLRPQCGFALHICTQLDAVPDVVSI